jgi:hypothetical protein
MFKLELICSKDMLTVYEQTLIDNKASKYNRSKVAGSVLMTGEMKQKRRATYAKTLATPGYTEKLKARSLKFWAKDPALKVAMSERIKQYINTPEHKSALIARLKNQWLDSAFSAKMTKISADRWAGPEGFARRAALSEKIKANFTPAKAENLRNAGVRGAQALSIPIQNMHTGVTYSSVSAAARAVGLKSTSSMRISAGSSYKKAAGVRWQYVTPSHIVETELHHGGALYKVDQ